MSTKKTTKKPAAKKAKAAAVTIPREQKNGVTSPGEGTACRAIWDACDELKAAGTEITVDALVEKLPKTNHATIRTQRQRWNTFNG